MAATPMTDRELRDQLLTMLVAGHETTATALAWAFERLLRSPAVLARTVAELGQGSTTYLDAAIKETLRLRPVVPITARKLTVPFEVGGRGYEPGTVLMPCIYLLHRHPDIYERAGGVPARALPGPEPAVVRLDPVRRRRPPLPRVGVRAGGDAGRHADGADARGAPARA